MEFNFLLWIVAVVLILFGLAGVVPPAVPGAPVLFAGLLIAAWADHFAYVGWRTLALLAVLALLTYAVDFAATAFGAKRFGASRRAVAGAAIGALAGIFFGFIGVLIGPFIGAVIGELSARRGLEDAARAGLGATIGMVVGVAAKLALAFAMLGIYAIARFT